MESAADSKLDLRVHFHIFRLLQILRIHYMQPRDILEEDMMIKKYKKICRLINLFQ